MEFKKELAKGLPESSNSDRMNSAIKPELIPFIWPRIKGFIEQSLEHAHRDCSLSYIEENLRSGSLRLWVSLSDEEIKGCVVAAIKAYPNHRVCFLQCIAGEYEALAELEKELIAWAKINKAFSMEGYGRKGWARKHSEGWKEVYRIYRKEI